MWALSCCEAPEWMARWAWPRSYTIRPESAALFGDPDLARVHALPGEVPVYVGQVSAGVARVRFLPLMRGYRDE